MLPVRTRTAVPAEESSRNAHPMDAHASGSETGGRFRYRNGSKQ
jgi:hypothetical protein